MYLNGFTAADVETTELTRLPATGPGTGLNTYTPIKIKLLPFVGTSTFNSYSITWLYNGTLIPGANDPILNNVDKPGTYKAIMALVANPATNCEATIHINAVPCKQPAPEVACGPGVVVNLPTTTAAGVTLAAGDKFTAGDYTIVISEIISGDPSGYTGTGYVDFKMLYGIVAKKIAIDFSNAVINDCYELVSGKVLSQYDPSWGNVIDVDAVVKGIKEIGRQIKSCFKSAEDYLQELEDNVNDFKCTAEDKAKIAKNLENLKNAKTCFETNGGLNETEINDIYNKINSIILKCNTCLLNCTVANGRVRSITDDCAIAAEIKTLMGSMDALNKVKALQFKAAIKSPNGIYYDLDNIKFLSHNSSRKTYYNTLTLNGAPLGFVIDGTEYLWKPSSNKYFNFSGFDSNKSPIWTSNSYDYTVAPTPKYYYKFDYQKYGSCSASVIEIAANNKVVEVFNYPGCIPLEKEKEKVEPKEEIVICPTLPTVITPNSLVTALFHYEKYQLCLNSLGLAKRKELIVKILRNNLVITECLQSGDDPVLTIGNCYEPLIRNLLLSTPDTDQKAILDELKKDHLFQSLYNSLQFETLDKVLTILSKWIKNEYPPKTPFDLNDFIVLNSSGNIDRGKSKLLSYGHCSNTTNVGIIVNGGYRFSYMAKLCAENVTIVEDMFAYVQVYFNVDLLADDGTAFVKGNSYFMPAVYAALIFNQAHRAKLIKASKVALDIGLLALGVGEISAAYKAYQVGKSVYSIYLITKSCSDMAFGITDLIIQNSLAESWKNSPDPDVRKRLDTWNKINLIYSLGSLGASAVDAARLKFNIGTEINDEAKFNSFADEVLNSSNLFFRGFTKDEFINSVSDFRNGGVDINDIELAWVHWKNQDWNQLYTLFVTKNYNNYKGIIYPPLNGFVDITPTKLPINFEFDRYGGEIVENLFSDFGKYCSPVNTPVDKRALPAFFEKEKLYKRYRVNREIENVYVGEIIPWFGKEGKGIQYLLPKSINDLKINFITEF